ncbi:unnamed protein product [Polarella glacialis]|uniref:Uncharacterized protein n=1 Tax=Polarella glacialis TaxID=89957 RepID=A0A813I8T6_POLGL|nr:unnamed protein product [Polarella glacialis]
MQCHIGRCCEEVGASSSPPLLSARLVHIGRNRPGRTVAATLFASWEGGRVRAFKMEGERVPEHVASKKPPTPPDCRKHDPHGEAPELQASKNPADPKESVS